MACEHNKARVTITTDDGEERTVCPICDDVRIETFDGDD